jgi:hypothetical protein
MDLSILHLKINTAHGRELDELATKLEAWGGRDAQYNFTRLAQLRMREKIVVKAIPNDLGGTEGRGVKHVPVRIFEGIHHWRRCSKDDDIRQWCQEAFKNLRPFLNRGNKKVIGVQVEKQDD